MSHAFKEIILGEKMNGMICGKISLFFFLKMMIPFIIWDILFCNHLITKCSI